MRTLDEVIKAWSICFSDNSRSNCTGCPYADEDGESACFNHDREDALHYLKEFQGLSKMWNDKLDKEQENPPLTWDELKQMEGKPVWVEAESISIGVSPYWKDWYIIKSFSDDDFMYCNDGYVWAKETQGRMWRAYRKERS